MNRRRLRGAHRRLKVKSPIVTDEIASLPMMRSKKNDFVRLYPSEPFLLCTLKDSACHESPPRY